MASGLRFFKSDTNNNSERLETGRMEETDTFREIVFLVRTDVADPVDFHSERRASRPVCLVRRHCCGYLRGYPHDRFCVERAGPRSSSVMGGLRDRLFRGDIRHSARHRGELDFAALHDLRVAGCGVSPYSIPFAPANTAEAVGLTGFHAFQRRRLGPAGHDGALSRFSPPG